MSKKKYKPVDLNKVSRYSIKNREHKTETESFGKPISGKLSANEFLDALPSFLKASDFVEFIELAKSARRNERPFHWLMGAHVIKVGLAPIIIDLMEKNIVTGLSFNSAGIIHDLELAFYGSTSEDVQAGLNDGSFGMVEETGKMFGELSELLKQDKGGLGNGVGKYISEKDAPYKAYSLFYNAYRLELPATVHIGIGTDTIAQHPEFDPSTIAEASHTDFKILSSICEDLNDGGVAANIGSAVILPEVFLKALTVARNLTDNKNKITTANFDMITHYRPTMNILNRPTVNAGKGFNFVGHHEIMIPLLAWGLNSND